MADQKIVADTIIQANKSHQAIYDSLMNKMIGLSRRYKEVRGMDFIAILAKLLGVLIARTPEVERDIAKVIALTNIDKAIAEIHPPKTGV